MTETANAVSRILSEKVAGRDRNGSIDLLWVNGENFAAMKKAGLLQDQPWVTSLPNWRYTDSEALPAILSDFAEPTDGKESPWAAPNWSFSMIVHGCKIHQNQRKRCLTLLQQNPGRFTFPQPPDFIGTSFLKQILIEISNSSPALYQPVDDTNFDRVTAPLWRWLDEAKPDLWRGGNVYPAAGGPSPTSWR